MLSNLCTLYDHRELLIVWTLREIKIRYKQSVFGSAWAILQPLALMLAFTAIFSLIIKMPSDGVPYPLFSYTALLAWTFFATSISFGIPTLVQNLNLVTKVYFPREILPIASVAAAFVDFLVASTLLLGAIIFFQVPLTSALAWVPVLVVIQFALTLGIVLPTAALNVFYRDVRFIIPLAVQLWLYATPVIYPISQVPESFRTLYSLNPMAGLIDSYRQVILHGSAPNPQYLATSAIISFALLLVGYTYFKRCESTFADLI